MDHPSIFWFRGTQRSHDGDGARDVTIPLRSGCYGFEFVARAIHPVDAAFRARHHGEFHVLLLVRMGEPDHEDWIPHQIPVRVAAFRDGSRIREAAMG